MNQQNSFNGFFDSTGQPLSKLPDAILPSTQGAIFNRRGEVLLQKRADNGYWALPGGRVDIGESVEEGVIREVLEETGLSVTVKRLIGVYSGPKDYSTVMVYPSGQVVQFVALVFACEVQSGQLQISDESTDIEYFPTDSLPEDTLYSHRIRIQDALAQQVEAYIR